MRSTRTRTKRKTRRKSAPRKSIKEHYHHILRRMFKIGSKHVGSYQISDGLVDINYYAGKLKNGVDGLLLRVDELKRLPERRIISFMVENGMPRDVSEWMYKMLVKDVKGLSRR